MLSSEVPLLKQDGVIATQIGDEIVCRKLFKECRNRRVKFSGAKVSSNSFDWAVSILLRSQTDDFYVFNAPVGQAEVVDFDRASELILITIIMFGRSDCRVGRVSDNATARFRSLEFPLIRVAVTKDVAEVDVVQRVIHSGLRSMSAMIVPS